MPSTPSSLLRLELQATGENLAIWGSKLNDLFTATEQSIASVYPITITGDRTLTSDNYVANEYRRHALVLTGSPAADFTITVPAVSFPHRISNRTNKQATIKTATGAAAIVRVGMTTTVLCDGTDCTAIDPTLDKIAKPTAALDLNNQKVSNQAAGTALTDSATLSNRLDQFAAPTGPVGFNGQRAANIADGTANTDAASVGQVTTIVQPFATSASNSASSASASVTLAQSWAATTGAQVASTDYSAKEYAIGTAVPAGSAKSWAISTNAVAGGFKGAYAYAMDAASSASAAAASAAAASSAQAITGPATSTTDNIVTWAGNKVVKDSGIKFGTAANNAVQVSSDGYLPTLDGRRLTNVPAGGAAPWAQVASVTVSTAVATIDFLSIPQTYKELLVQGLEFTTSSAQPIQFAVSANGTTWSPGGSISAANAASASNFLSEILNYTKDFSKVSTSAYFGGAMTSPDVEASASPSPLLIRCTGGLKNLRILIGGGSFTFTAGTFVLFAR